MGKENKKRIIVTVILIAACVLIIAGTVLAAVLLSKKSSGRGRSKDKDGDSLSNKKYAAECGLERGEHQLFGTYDVNRCVEESRFDYLRITNWYPENEKRDYISYLVFNSSKDAKKYFSERYNSYVDCNAIFEDREKNWFIVEEPVVDAEITTIYYLEDNVIIYTAVKYISYETGSGNDESSNTTLSFRESELKDYILDNASDLREYVLTEIL